MAKYTIVERSYIDNHLREPGEVIDYDPPKGTEIGDNMKIVKTSKRGASTDDVDPSDASADTTDALV